MKEQEENHENLFFYLISDLDYPDLATLVDPSAPLIESLEINCEKKVF